VALLLTIQKNFITKEKPFNLTNVLGLFAFYFFIPQGILKEIEWISKHGSYLVDPASSHMLVSKIKPCMSKYKQFYTVKLRMAH
jgi:hypothetical protein